MTASDALEKTPSPLRGRAARVSDHTTDLAAWSLTLATLAISAAIIFTTTDPWLHAVSFAVVAIGLVLAVNGDLIHPYTWYSPVFCAYAVAVPILIGSGELDDYGSFVLADRLTWLALASIVVIVGPSRITAPRIDRQDLQTSAAPAIWLLLITTVLTVPYLWAVGTGGFTSKLEITLSDNIWLRLTPVFNVQAFAFAVLASRYSTDPKKWWSLCAFMTLWTGFAFLITGERDYVIRVVWIAAFLYHLMRYRIRKGLLAGFGISLALVLPILGDYKNVFLTGYADVNWNRLWLRTLLDEFLTAGRNLQVLIDGADAWLPFYGETLWWDFKRTVIPTAVFPGLAGPTPTEWFNNLFYSERVIQGGGVGFSLVGEGYINFGVAGVVLWFAAIGLFARYLYRQSASSRTAAVIYVVSMPILLYTIRADLAGVSSQWLKHVILPAVALDLSNRAARQMKHFVRK